MTRYCPVDGCNEELETTWEFVSHLDRIHDWVPQQIKQVVEV